MTTKSTNSNTPMARCPVTGQMGVCPSQSFGTNSDSSANKALSPREQQAHLWQSLLERNGHCTKSVKANNSSTPTKTLEDAEDSSSTSSTISSSLPPDLSRASFYTQHDSDCESLGSRSGPPQDPERAWPTYDQVSAHVLVADYRESLTSGADQHAPEANVTKLLCPHGVVCQARMEFFEAPGSGNHNNYTGLLTPGSTAEHCLVRLSSALRPVDNGGGAWAKAVARRTFGAKLASSQILPAAAIKCFRNNGVDSGNILLMGSKVGQPDRNFFKHALCTAVTEKIPALGLPFLRRFSRYSKYPLSLGLSELCRYDAQGDEALDPVFPFALCLKPVARMEETNANDNEEDDERPFDAFIEDIPQRIAPGTHLFDVFAAPTPESIGESHRLQRIGRVVSTSHFVYSSPTDGLTFRHQVKEDDLELQPTWEDRMNTHVVRAPDGTKGSAAKLAGWQIFEDNIQQNGDYVDFEENKKTYASPPKKSKNVSFAAQRLAQPSALAIDGWSFCGYKKAQVTVA